MNNLRHIAIIMDGNGRWAQARGLSRSEGHRAGSKQVEAVVDAAIAEGVEVLTLYAFSTENWNRPRLEVETLMKLFAEYARHSLDGLQRRGIRLRVVGRMDGLPMLPRMALNHAIEATQKNAVLTLNIALNYGGRAELVDAASKVVAARMKSGDSSPVTEEEFAAALYAPDLPPPDLLIRTGGELRISNFLLWELSYAEFYFTEVLWPDFGPAELHAAIEEFGSRQRRFGKV
ncbi:MAG: di-trans,poly-cis-decaprenylcistransferase [Victivallales bacterium]|nr:di-trans,poly-cis-decaprenylcistransferase [Victivallales bacterium]